MTNYVKRAEVIKAIQYKGLDKLEEVRVFMGDDDFHNILIRPMSAQLVISDVLPEVKVGYYIIRDFKQGYIVMSSEEFERRHVKEVN